MKKNLLISIAAILFSAVLVGCSTTGGSTENNYYGNSNTPDERVIVEKPYAAGVESDEQTDENWENPLSENVTEDGENSENESTAYQEVNNYYTTPHYVPVIVPWWYDYYGWGWYPRYWGGYIGYGSYYGYDWYSPWYNYNPYYGYYWNDYTYYGHHNWYNQPYYSYDRRSHSRRSYRNFGSRRGGHSIARNNSVRKNDFNSIRRHSGTSVRRATPGTHSVVTSSRRTNSTGIRLAYGTRTARGNYVNAPSQAVSTAKASTRTVGSSRKSRSAVTGVERNKSTGSNNWKTIYSRSGSRKASSDNSAKVTRTKDTRSSSWTQPSRKSSGRSSKSVKSRSAPNRSSGVKSSGRKSSGSSKSVRPSSKPNRSSGSVRSSRSSSGKSSGSSVRSRSSSPSRSSGSSVRSSSGSSRSSGSRSSGSRSSGGSRRSR